MPEWSDRFKNHPVHKQIDNAMALLEGYPGDKLPPAELPRYARVLKALKYFKMRIASLDPELTGVQFLNNLANPLSNIFSQINNFVQNKNTAYLRQANSFTDQALDVLGAAGFMDSPDAVKSTIEASSGFQAKTVEQLNQLITRANTFKAELDALSNVITQQKGRVDSNDKTIEQQKTRLDQAIAQFQKQFSETEANRAKEFVASSQKNNETFNGEITKFKQAFEANITIHKERVAASYEDMQNKSEEHLAWMKQKEEEVKRIFNVIGNVAVAGDYKNTAEQERKTANIFRWIALGLMGTMIAVALISFYYTLINHEFDWHVFIFRLATSVLLLVPAIYAAQESTKHRERERINRKLQLELSAIDAYLELLPSEKRQEIKGKMTEKFFGLVEAAPKEDEVTKHALLDIVKTVVGNLTKGK